MYDELRGWARAVCAGSNHDTDPEDLLHQVLLRAVEKGWDLGNRAQLYSAIKGEERHEYHRHWLHRHLGRRADSLDYQLTETFDRYTVVPSGQNVELEVERGLLLVWATEQAPEFPGIWAKIAQELGYTDEEIGRTLGLDPRLVARVRSATVIKGERVVEVCRSCRRQAPLDPEFLICASCRIPDHWVQLPLPPAPMIRVRYPRAVKEPKPRVIRWSRKHECCVTCGRTDSKHMGHGECNRCLMARRNSARANLVG